MVTVFDLLEIPDDRKFTNDDNEITLLLSSLGNLQRWRKKDVRHSYRVNKTKVNSRVRFNCYTLWFEVICCVVDPFIENWNFQMHCYLIIEATFKKFQSLLGIWKKNSQYLLSHLWSFFLGELRTIWKIMEQFRKFRIARSRVWQKKWQDLSYRKYFFGLESKDDIL